MQIASGWDQAASPGSLRLSKPSVGPACLACAARLENEMIQFSGGVLFSTFDCRILTVATSLRKLSIPSVYTQILPSFVRMSFVDPPGEVGTIGCQAIRIHEAHLMR
jgi:hypothetical protein